MPLYDCMLLVKPRVKKEEVMQLMARVGRGVFQRNGVITELKSFGKVPLAYGIKKLDGRHFEVNFIFLLNSLFFDWLILFCVVGESCARDLLDEMVNS